MSTVTTNHFIKFTGTIIVCYLAHYSSIFWITVSPLLEILKLKSVTAYSEVLLYSTTRLMFGWRAVELFLYCKLCSVRKKDLLPCREPLRFRMICAVDSRITKNFEKGLAWSVLSSTTNTRHHSGQNVLDSEAQLELNFFVVLCLTSFLINREHYSVFEDYYFKKNWLETQIFATKRMFCRHLESSLFSWIQCNDWSSWQQLPRGFRNLIFILWFQGNLLLLID